MEGLTQLEQAVLDKLLSGEHPALVTLRAQAQQARLRGRENTGVGFFCSFEVSPEAERLDRSTFQLSDVSAEVSGLSHGAGFVLFVKDGELHKLEGYTFDEPWPDSVADFELSYEHSPRTLTFPDSSAS